MWSGVSIRRTTRSGQEVVNKQYKDFIDREVYTLITPEEDKAYVGPKFYVNNHVVIKQESASTPARLVTNSSLKYKGVSLNDVWMKGPNTLNNIYSVQLKFRCYPVPLVCDIIQDVSLGEDEAS